MRPTSARCSRRSPKARAASVNAGSVAATAQADAQMTGMLGRLFAVAEAYPELKANTNFLQLQDQLANIEGELQSARRYYNATVRDLNSTHPELPAGADRAAAGLHRGAVLPGRRSGHPKRAEGVVRPPGGLTMRRAWRARLAALLLLARAGGGAGRRAHPSLSERRPDPEGQLARGHRDDRRPRRERPRSTTASTAISRPAIAGRTAARSASASPSKARPSTAARCRPSTEPFGNGVRIKIGDPDKIVDVGEHATSSVTARRAQIGRFKDYDELYWNATGNGWMFPIDVAEARIRLPAAGRSSASARSTPAPQGSTASERRGRRREARRDHCSGRRSRSGL